MVIIKIKFFEKCFWKRKNKEPLTEYILKSYWINYSYIMSILKIKLESGEKHLELKYMFLTQFYLLIKQ